MITRPDFLQKQILVIHSSEIKSLSFRNENICIKNNGEIQFQTSLYKVFTIFVIWEATISTKLIQKLWNFWVSLVLLKQNLELITVIWNPLAGNTLLREKQYEISKESTHKLILARNCICNKIQNQEALLKKIRNKDEVLKHTHKKLHEFLENASIVHDAQILLGIEWNAARYFFHEYYREFDWMWRYPRTKIDINNVLLDMGYTFLFHFIEALMVLYGFDIYEWFYHTRFYQRKSLVCDIIEPFRPIIDESIRIWYHLGQISKKDFFYSWWCYSLNPQKIGKYSMLFSRAILAHKEGIYDYVHDFYRYILHDTERFPFYPLSL